jgi:hypothetical protein
MLKQRRGSALSTAALAVTLATAVIPAGAQAGTLSVLAPASVAGAPATGDAAFGPQEFDVGGDLIAAEDPSDPAGPSTGDGCSPLVNSTAVSGRIALVDRGTCAFTMKVKHAQDAGALGVVVVNSVDGPPGGMGAAVGDPLAGEITIPSVLIARTPGLQLRTALVDGTVRVRMLRDTTGPVLTIPGSITVNASGPLGAAVAYTVSASDNLDPSPTVSCSPASGASFSIGSTTVGCSATDSAGNGTSASFSVVVKGAAQQASDLSTLVKGINLKQGIANSLDAKLQGVRDALASLQGGNTAAACNKLDAAINEISAQSGKDITVPQASDLIADINRIKAVIGCP